MKFWYFFALKFIKLLLLNRYKFLPFVLLLSIFLTLEIAVVYVKNEVYFLSIKTQQTEKDIQKEKEKVDSAEQGDQLAISCEGIHIGKNVSPGEILYSYMTLDEVNSWEKDLQSLTDPEKQLFEEIRRLVKVVF
jgi:hypothetical protein